MLLVTDKSEMRERGLNAVDVLIITGDAYVDHSSFGAALVGRYIESLGLVAGILAQPNLRSDHDFLRMGRPRLAVMVTAGNLDSMLCHYTAARHRRRVDDYSPGGKKGLRPDYASVVYTRRAREAFGSSMPVILGGVEASLRRFAHYDYWKDTVLPSVLIESGADLLLYGMAEPAIKAVINALPSGGVDSCRNIPGLAYATARQEHLPARAKFLPAFELVSTDKKAFARAYRIAEDEQNFFDGKPLVQRHNDVYLVCNPPSPPMPASELDRVYELPFERRAHESYESYGGVPAISEVSFSLTSHRGCFGGCSFCALTFHQGRIIQSRSSASLIREAKRLTGDKEFKGYIHDVGGPTANFRSQLCPHAARYGPCRGKSCLHPYPCRRLPLDSSEYEKLLTALRKLPGVKKVFIRSGLRFDYALAEKSRSFLHTLCRFHISGQLKVAPEHVSDRVLHYMSKPRTAVFEEFCREYASINAMMQKKQFLVPYFLSSHPGATLQDAVMLAEYLRDHHLRPEQAQDFIPTPGSRATCMYYTGLDPYTGEAVHSAKDPKEKAMGRALIQYWLPKNKPLVKEALLLSGRGDLIGQAKKCLIRP